MNKFGYDLDPLPVFHLVSCVNTKVIQKAPIPAKDLYCSQWFKLVRRVIEQRNEPWAILSARYRLLSPESMVFAYNDTLATKPRAERLAWAKWVLDSVPRAERYVIWGGEHYFEFLAEPLKAQLPLRHLGIGRQLGQLTRWANGAEQFSLAA